MDFLHSLDQMHHPILFTECLSPSEAYFFQAETLSEMMFKSPPSLYAEYSLKEFFRRTARSPSPRRMRFAPAYILWQDSKKHRVWKFALHIPTPAPSPPKNKPNTRTPRSQRGEIPWVAGREGACPRCGEDNKGKKSSRRRVGQAGLGAGSGGGEEWAPGKNKSPDAAAASSPCGAAWGEGLPQGRPEAAATRALPARPSRGPPGARGVPCRDWGKRERERAAAASPHRPRRRAGPGALPWARKGAAGPRRPGNGAAPLAEANWGGEQDPPARPCPVHRRLRGSRPPPPAVRQCRPRVCLVVVVVVAAAVAFTRAKMADESAAHARAPRGTLGIVVRAALQPWGAGRNGCQDERSSKQCACAILRSMLGTIVLSVFDAWEAAPTVPPRLGG